MNHMGVRGNLLKWFSSYLFDRKKHVKIQLARSSSEIISTGVPQSSELSPTLFLININDMAKTTKILNFLQFADDMTIVTVHI